MSFHGRGTMKGKEVQWKFMLVTIQCEDLNHKVSESKNMLVNRAFFLQKAVPKH